jgi:predicted outer membrane protein
MERTHRAHALRIAVAAGLGLCLSLPLAAQDMTEGTRLGNRADKASTSGNRATASNATASRAADERFLTKATKGNEKEVAAATVALQKASSQDVRDYANHLLRDHQDMLVKLDETAVALGVSQTRRYTAMAGWGSGMRDGTDPHPAQDNISASAAGAGDSNTNANNRTSGPTDAQTAAAGGDTGDDLANSTGSAVGQGGTAGKAATAAGGTSTGSTVTGRGTTTGSSSATGSISTGSSMVGSGSTSAGTSASTTASGAGSTGYESSSMASTDANRSATGMTAQAVPASASNDPAVRKLAGLSGEAFDRAFAEQMVADHKKTVAEFERASKDNSLSEQTRTLATDALPKLRNHLAMAESLRGNLKTSAK